jgi:hypothetical protein
MTPKNAVFHRLVNLGVKACPELSRGNRAPASADFHEVVFLGEALA